MDKQTDIIIAGGGLAGLTAAIHLLKSGLSVTLIEKTGYPHHKVCGEYISNEVLPYLQWLGIDLSSLSPTRIEKFSISDITGRSADAVLPLGGFGLSRYTLDKFLYDCAVAAGCRMIQDTVTNISFDNDQFSISLANHKVLYAKIAIAAYGKRDALDQKLSRAFIRKKSPWLAVKAHYEISFPQDLVALHNFEGGYCGISCVENNRVNICYLVDYASFKRYKSISEHRINVLYQNKHLKKIFEQATILFDQPITISQISFDKKTTVENHVLMIGDTAGLIHPLCGNGMAMAIHSARICAELVVDYTKGNILSRTALERNYTKLWNKTFSKRLQLGKLIATLLRKEKLSAILMRILIKFPSLLTTIIRQTHGKAQ